jgi:superfamily II DNA or RNA helicase
MLNALAKDEARNRLISTHIVTEYRAGRHQIILSDRLSQLEALSMLLEKSGVAADHISRYTGSTPAKKRPEAASKAVVLATYSMAKEGLDIPTLDTLVFATPSGNVEQAVGRIQRPCATKQTPLVIDIVDSTSSAFMSMYGRRRSFYKRRALNLTDVESH